MPINNNYYVVLDFETVNLKKNADSPCEIAAKIIDGRTLEWVEGSEFSSLMRPTDWNVVEDAALNVNKITREELMDAPNQKDVWLSFVDYLKRYTKGSPRFGGPYLVTYNGDAFDYPILLSLCERYKNVDKEGIPTIISTFMSFDVMKLLFLFFENAAEVERYRLDYIREFMGVSKEMQEQSHRALTDVEFTGALFIRLLKFFRNASPKIKFKGCFAGVK